MAKHLLQPLRHPALLIFVCAVLGMGLLGPLTKALLHFRLEAAQEPERNSANDVKRAIRKVLDDQATAWNKGDLDGFMAGYWKSPELSFSSGKDRTHGWQATFDRYKKRYQSEGHEMGSLSFSELEIEPLCADNAFVRGRWKLVASKETLGGLFTLIFKKLPEGWRIIHDHTSG